MIFTTKQDKFFDLLNSISKNLKETGKHFKECDFKNISDLKEFASVMKEYEHKGDSYIHTVIAELNKTFITPIEREDILLLAQTMDNVLDGIEHCAARFEMYSISILDEFMVQFINYIHEGTVEIHNAVKLLEKGKLGEIRPYAIRIKDLESRCDEVYRVSIKHLFAKESDPIQLIKYKEIYEMLESIADDCQDVANVLETIVMRNA